MVDAWIELRCPSCGRRREASPSDLPAPDERFTCESCGETRTTAQFMKEQRDLEILEEFAE